MDKPKLEVITGGPTFKVCRASGMPVQLDHIEKFQDEYRILYDKILNKFHDGQNKFIDAAMSQRMNRLLSRLEKRLHLKYPNTADWSFLTTPEAWAAKIVEVNAPIALAKARDTNELTYVILDTEF